ncbi:hypothetical protein DEA06_08290 [Microbacterium sp. Gd 4-13]|uniref:hypothetical protein n=1 Tax=Microbacterium sp. Gd 4-13 TaxID=2173179 RepID=UPI000D5858BB|nr:hypothetical protein [Microbacterium sp. Gd 4-13]PVW04764.1 hypothetical protein DEA06_08290 [Microbacterium sp. Gd 4-13]
MTTLPDWLTTLIAVVPALAFVIASFSLFVAISSRNTARRSLGIAQRAEARGRPDVDIYLVQARQQTAAGGYALVLHVQIINLSHNPIWIRRAALWVEYSVGEAPMLTEIAAGAVDHKLGDAVTLPLELKPRQVSEGWLTFAVSNDRTGGQPVRRQGLRLTDTDNKEWVLDDIKGGL